MVDCTALEMRHTRKRIGGSNPSLSAILVATFIFNSPQFIGMADLKAETGFNAERNAALHFFEIGEKGHFRLLCCLA